MYDNCKQKYLVALSDCINDLNGEEIKKSKKSSKSNV